MENEKEIIKNNQLIAEFVGFKQIRGQYYEGFTNSEKYTFPAYQDINEIIADKRNQFANHELSFHKSWDWLMPVVDKIGEYRLAYPSQVEKLNECSIFIDKLALYNLVVDFIKWYNKESH